MQRRWIHHQLGREVKELGGFPLLYIDPPWQYVQGGRGAAVNHYRTMSQQELCALPVWDLAAPNAVMFMWGTWALTPEALEVMRAWGFKFKTLAFDWVKVTKNGKEHFGLGQWTRANSEPCWLAVRGTPPRRVDAGIRQLLLTPAEAVVAEKREHSRKPVEVRQRIEKLMGLDLPSIELFARERVDGWEAWGDAVEQTVTLTDSI